MAGPTAAQKTAAASTDTRPLPLGAALQEIVARATARRVDPLAAIAVARQEGLGGGIGDSGTSFGPFQLHYGGAYPAGAPRGSQQASQDWAWSRQGIDYAVDQIAKISAGQIGSQAIYSIVSRFERPKDVSSEVLKATDFYGELRSRASSIVTAQGQLAPGATAVISTIGTGSASQHAGSGDLGTVAGVVTGGASSAAGAYAQGASDVAGKVTGPIHTVEDAIKFLFSYRFLEIVGGLGLIGFGVLGLMREAGIRPPVPTPFGIDPIGAAFPSSTQNTSGEPLSQSSRAARRRAGFESPADRKPARGEPGSSRLARGDEIPF